MKQLWRAPKESYETEKKYLDFLSFWNPEWFFSTPEKAMNNLWGIILCGNSLIFTSGLTEICWCPVMKEWRLDAHFILHQWLMSAYFINDHFINGNSSPASSGSVYWPLISRLSMKQIKLFSFMNYRASVMRLKKLLQSPLSTAWHCLSRQQAKTSMFSFYIFSKACHRHWWREAYYLRDDTKKPQISMCSCWAHWLATVMNDPGLAIRNKGYRELWANTM